MGRFIIGAAAPLVSALADTFTRDDEVLLLGRYDDRLVVDMPEARAVHLREALGAAVAVEHDVEVDLGPVVPTLPPPGPPQPPPPPEP